MQLSLQNFTTLMENMAASVQGAATQLLDLTVGSVLRAILEANAAIALWLQWLIVQVLGVTRAATSTGSDLDSWVADFSLTRLPPSSAAGSVTFSRYTPTLSAFIPVNAQVISSDGSQSFMVVADPSNVAYSAPLGGYTLGAGVSSLSLPVAASMPGSDGNIAAGAATVLGSAIAGVDTVTNALPFAGGANPESDAALRSRFALYIQTRALATKAAIGSALQAIQQGVSYAIAENTNAAGVSSPGSFLVTIDDGSGNPPPSLLSAATVAVEAVRPVGSSFAVQPPSVYYATVMMTLSVSDATTLASAVVAVTAALVAYIDALSIGAPLTFTRLLQIAYDATPLVTNVTGATLNGGNEDFIIPSYGVIKAGPLVIS